MLAALASIACARSAPIRPADAPPGAELPRDVHPIRYALELVLLPERDRFQGEVAIEVELYRPAEKIWLHALDLTTSDAWVEVAGGRVAATLEQVTPSGLSRLAPARTLAAGRAKLHVAFEGAWSDRLPGLHRVRARGATYAYTQLDAAEARRVFPGFDEPAFKAPFDVSLVVPEDAVAISNAPAAGEEKMGAGTKRVRFGSTAPLPTHLVFGAVGPFDVVEPPPLSANEVRTRSLSVRAVVPRGAGPRMAFALEATREILPILERWFGMPFPYDKLDEVVSPDLPFDGIAFAGATLHRDERLAFEPGESAEEKRLEVGRLLARAMALQWFGGLVTPARPEHAWLGDAFATFVAWKVVDAWRPDAREPERVAARIDSALEVGALPGAPALRQPLRRTADFSVHLEEPAVQSAAVLGTFEHFVGEARFRDGVRAFLRAHAHRTATTEDALAAVSRAAGRDLAPGLRSLLDVPGVPHVEARPVCDRSGPRVELTVGRERPLGSTVAPDAAFDVPVCARYEAAGTLGEACTLVEKGRGVLALPACPRWVMPAAGGNVCYRWGLGPVEMARLRDVGLLHLTPAERISYAHALRAAARAGRVPYADVLGALAPLARDGSRRVATSPIPALTEAIEHLVPDQARQRARARAADIYRPRLRELGLEPSLGEPVERRGLRRDVVEFLVHVGRDPETTHALAALGTDAQLGQSRSRNAVVDPDLAPAALSAAVIEGDSALFDALERRLHRTQDGELRASILEALSAARGTLSARVHVLAGDPRLRGYERVRALFAQASRPETRAATWKAVESRWGFLVESLPPSLAEALPEVSAGLCDRARIQAVERFLATRVDDIPGARRHLRAATDSIELCAALRDAQGASASAYLSR